MKLNMDGPIILAAGGTGGHMFPAQALAEVLLARGETVVIATDERGRAYEEQMPGVEFVEINSATLSGSGLAKIKGLMNLFSGYCAARRLIFQRKPKVVVGFGGYPSVPTVMAAQAKRYPTAIHEQNSVPGRANRLLSHKARLIATSFPMTELLPKSRGKRIRHTGNPVRAGVRALYDQPYVLPDLPEGEAPFHILVVGGSQGAQVFAQLIPDMLALLKPELRGRIHITQQCRGSAIDTIRHLLNNLRVPCDLAAFFRNIPEKLGQAHLVIGRAGASTVAENTTAGRPAVMVPYPYAVDDHQYLNAKSVVDAGGGWILEEESLKPKALADLVSSLLEQPEKLTVAAANARSWARPDAAEALADAIEAMLNKLSGNVTPLAKEPSIAAKAIEEEGQP